jgi:hypothetical protein
MFDFFHWHSYVPAHIHVCVRMCVCAYVETLGLTKEK